MPTPVESIDWSPTDNLMAIWCAGGGDKPAKLVISRVPTAEQVTTRTIFYARESRIHWQERGDLAAVVVSKKQGKKKEVSSIELFDLRGTTKGSVPFESLDLKDATVYQLYWELGGSSRFAVILEDEDTHSTKRVAFFEVKLEFVIEVIKVAEFPMPITGLTIFKWAPNGQYFVMGAPKEGDMLFCYINPENKLDVIHKDEHYFLTDVFGTLLEDI
eukprot:Platyproteum_vivax@DN6843_c0_g1_i1.p2